MRLLYSKPELRDLSQGSRISFARQFRFMSQHELANKLGISGDKKKKSNDKIWRRRKKSKGWKNKKLFADILNFNINIETYDIIKIVYASGGKYDFVN